MNLRFLLLLAACLCWPPRSSAQRASTNYFKNFPKGPQVYGCFEGRSPCQEIARLLGAERGEECTKIKWQLILFQDPVTKAPTTYALGGFAWRNPPKFGKWTLLKGTREEPNAEVIRLDPEVPKAFLSFLKGDDNILFFLDHQHRLMVGNKDFSFTLNRIAEK